MINLVHIICLVSAVVGSAKQVVIEVAYQTTCVKIMAIRRPGMDNYKLCEEHVEMYTNVLFYLRAAKALLLRTTAVVGAAKQVTEFCFVRIIFM